MLKKNRATNSASVRKQCLLFLLGPGRPLLAQKHRSVSPQNRKSTIPWAVRKQVSTNVLPPQVSGCLSVSSCTGVPCPWVRCGAGGPASLGLALLWVSAVSVRRGSCPAPALALAESQLRPVVHLEVAWSIPVSCCMPAGLLGECRLNGGDVSPHHQC